MTLSHTRPQLLILPDSIRRLSDRPVEKPAAPSRVGLTAYPELGECGAYHDDYLASGGTDIIDSRVCVCELHSHI